MATKPKPKGWNSLTKAQQEAWKKKNFDRSTKVTEAQLDKLRKEGTPTKAIAKYKNDPAMREALNRFYGKDRVTKAIGSGTGSTSTPGGPGSKMPGSMPKGSGPGNTRPKTRPGGPGAKTGADGRMSSSSTKKKSSMSNQDKLMIAAGIAALGAGARRVKNTKPNRAITQGLKQIEAGPKGKAEMAKAKSAAAAKTKGKYAASGSSVKTPVTRTTPGKYAAPKTGNAAKLGKAAKVVGKAAKFAGLNTPAGRVIAAASIASGFIKPLDIKGNNKRIAPMGNPKKITKK